VTKKDIRILTLEQLITELEQLGEAKFRAKQIYHWLWQKSARSFEDMSSLSKDLRAKLKENYTLNPVQIANQQISSDKTIKLGFKLHDDHLVEGVLIPTSKRMTACISSQVGCSLTCKFCATGKLKRQRNLSAGEIYDQVVLLNQQAEDNYHKPLSNIVLMGMGEPLLNYSEVLKGIEKITSEDGLHISSKRITLSTVGIAKMIKKLGDDNVKFNLALSLHAADDEKRSSIMPINDENHLDSLTEAIQYYQEKTNNRITLEYILFKNFNDSEIDAMNLAQFCKKIQAKVNIIEYNPIDNTTFEKANLEQLNKFAKYLTNENVFVSVRQSRGKDIDAACGQLANKNK